MSHTSRSLYNPRRTDHFVGEILHTRHGQRETDFDLYRDADTQSLFVVASLCDQNGPKLSHTHTVYTLDEFLELNPEHRRQIAAMPIGWRGPLG